MYNSILLENTLNSFTENAQPLFGMASIVTSPDKATSAKLATELAMKIFKDNDSIKTLYNDILTTFESIRIHWKRYLIGNITLAALAMLANKLIKLKISRLQILASKLVDNVTKALDIYFRDALSAAGLTSKELLAIFRKAQVPLDVSMPEVLAKLSGALRKGKITQNEYQKVYAILDTKFWVTLQQISQTEDRSVSRYLTILTKLTTWEKFKKQFKIGLFIYFVIVIVILISSKFANKLKKFETIVNKQAEAEKDWQTKKLEKDREVEEESTQLVTEVKSYSDFFKPVFTLISPILDRLSQLSALQFVVFAIGVASIIVITGLAIKGNLIERIKAFIDRLTEGGNLVDDTIATILGILAAWATYEIFKKHGVV